MSRVYVVRHAIAEDRERWTRPDSERPLTAEGLAQAEQLAKRFGDEGIRTVLSSPSVRCVQTVQPLAARLGVEVEHASVLAEGSDPRDALALFTSEHGGRVVACTHGDVIQGLLWLLQADGVLDDDDLRMKKASTWLLRIDNGRVKSGRYLPPP